MNVEIKDLVVQVGNKKVLDKLNLNIKPGEIHVIMGPNGVGKSTLSNVIMGNESYQVVSGDILCDNKSIKELTTDERARMGIFLSFQNPIEIDGITNSEFLRTAVNAKEEKMTGLFEFIKELEKNFQELELNKEMMHRPINQNFSGGEKKKNEILQMKMLKPKFIILDELDSGLDVDSLKIVCKNVTEYLQENKDASVLMITHYHKIFNYIKPDYVHVLMEKEIKLTGDLTLAEEIEKKGYKNLISCASKISGV